jgi:glucosamine--fructose-6-phosphate aminotransferase (isomerizing)
MKSFMRQEIESQPDLIRNLSNYWQETANELQSEIKNKKNIVLLGRGTSGNACVFASYLFGLSTGRHPIDFRPWLATQDTVYADWSDSLVLAYSQSGESTDIIHAASWLKERNARVISITNSESDNPSIKNVSDKVFFIKAGKENAVPATKSYSAQLIVTAALSGININEHTSEIANCIEKYLISEESKKLAEFVNEKNVSVWLSRGLIQPAALDASLKLQETVGVPSFGYSSAEFLHGPIACLNNKDCVILFDSHDKDNVPDSISKIINVLEQKNVDYLKISNKEQNKCLNINLPSENWAQTIVYSVVGQYNALLIAEKRNIDPDKPMGLKKITIT